MPFPHPQSHSIALACPYACSCNAALRIPASDLCFACRSTGLIKLTSARPRAWNSSFPGLEVLKGNEIARLCPYTHTHQISLRHQANTPVPDLPFPPAPAACLVHQRYLLVHTPCWVLQCMSCGARVVCLVALGCCVYLVHHRHVWCTKGILWMFGAPTVCFGAEYLWCTISHTEDTVYLPN